MTKLYDLCVATRSYKDSNGNEKAVWENIGSILKNEEGKVFMMLKAHFNPAGIQRKEGSESILVNMFQPKAKNNNDSSGYSGADDFQPASYDPNIPF